VATGAGAGAQNAIGTGVLGGMVTATVLVIVFAPLFFVIVETFIGAGRKGRAAGPGVGKPAFTALKERLSGIRERLSGKRGRPEAVGTDDPTPSEDR
jgi:hypothetical protein